MFIEDRLNDLAGGRRMASTGKNSEGRRAQQAAATRQRILDAALDLFAQDDPARVTTRQVAAAAGVAEGLVFHYFPTRENLLAAALAGRDALLERMTGRLDEVRPRPVETALPELARIWLGDLSRQPALSALVFSSDARPEAVASLCGPLAEALSARLRQGELRPGLPAEAAARLFLLSLLDFFHRPRQVECVRCYDRALQAGALLRAVRVHHEIFAQPFRCGGPEHVRAAGHGRR
jgi:AcrR family transcriptional regulator